MMMKYLYIFLYKLFIDKLCMSVLSFHHPLHVELLYIYITIIIMGNTILSTKQTHTLMWKVHEHVGNKWNIMEYELTTLQNQ